MADPKPTAALKPSAPAPTPAAPARVAPPTPQAQKQALAASVAEPVPGMNPAKELADRQRGAIERAVGNSERAQVDGATEGAPTRPKAATSTSAKPATGGASAPSTPAGSAPTSATSPNGSPPDAKTDTGSTPPVETPADGKPASSTPSAERGPRYDLKSFKKWAEQNPEQAAQFAKDAGIHVFKADKDSTQEWIAFQNKGRKLKEDLKTERADYMSKAEAKVAEATEIRALADKAIGSLAPIADLWEACRTDPAKPDFDAADAAFKETSGMDIDSYMRLRARRGIVNPELARERAARARAERELAALKPPAAPAAAAPEAGKPPVVVPPKPAAKEEPAFQAGKWEGEVPKKHQLRQIVDWEQKLDAEMSRYHDDDTGDYDADVEDVANRVLQRELDQMMADFEGAAPAPKVTPKAPKTTPKVRRAPADAAPAAPPAKDDDEEAKALGLMPWAERQKRAMDRAMRRARGEQVD